jgi:1-deoxy-D-xylulose-5-phosphate reductoisomerase
MSEQNILEPFDLTKISQLTFEKPRYDDFPCLNLAFEALKIGHSMPAVLNSTNEAVVELFLNGKIKFTEIPKIIEKFMENHVIIENPNLNTLLELEKEIKDEVNRTIS